MIKLDNVSFSYDNPVLDKINLTIDKNKITYIVGTNGSGKSTLASIISGLLPATSGKVYVDDIEVKNKENSKKLREKIGIVFQNPSNQIIFSNVYDDIEFTLKNLKRDKKDIPNIINESLKKVNMLDFIHANPYKLSGGEKQRVAIASQLALNPDYIIFDEATSMLDINGKNEIYKLMVKLKEQIGIIFITNNMDELIYAEDIIIIDNHKAYKYTLEEVLDDSSILTRHNLLIPFTLKLAKTLNIHNVNDFNEDAIIERISKND